MAGQPTSLPAQGCWASPGRVNTELAASPQRQDEDSVPSSGTSQPQHQGPAAGLRLHPDICGKGGLWPVCFEVGAQGTIVRVTGPRERGQHLFPRPGSSWTMKRSRKLWLLGPGWDGQLGSFPAHEGRCGQTRPSGADPRVCSGPRKACRCSGSSLGSLPALAQ